MAVRHPSTSHGLTLNGKDLVPVVAAFLLVGLVFLLYSSAADFDIKAHLQSTKNGTPSEETPAGVPGSWSWVIGADGDSTAPPSAAHTTANYWGAVFRTQENTTPANTKVEIRNCGFYILYNGESAWTKVQDAPLGGASFTPTYGYDNPNPILLELTADGADVIPAEGYIWHYWAASGHAPVQNNNIKEVMTNCQARLALRDQAGPDDRDQAGYIIHMGADWRNPNDIGCANENGICPAFGVGKFMRVTNDWRNITYHTMNDSEITSGTLPPASAFTFPGGTSPATPTPTPTMAPSPTQSPTGAPSPTPAPTQGPASEYDLDGSGEVGITDLSRLILDYPRPGKPGATDSPADFNGNGKVDISDLSLLIAHWGS